MFLVFFFNDPATTEIYTLSLHDALPISADSIRLSAALHAGRFPVCHPSPYYGALGEFAWVGDDLAEGIRWALTHPEDRKSTRLNSSHSQISYAVFCLKKKTTASRQPPNL